jgi:hypothetical protein
MFPLNTILAWNINIIMNKKCDNNNIIIASRAYFLQFLLHMDINSLCFFKQRSFFISGNTLFFLVWSYKVFF